METLTTGAKQLKNEFRLKRNELIEMKKITFTKFCDFICSRHDELNNEQGKLIIYNVYYGRSSSLTLLKELHNYQKEMV